MKRLLAAAVCFVLAWGSARGQIPVFDGASAVSQAKSLFQDLKGYATQLQQLQQEIQTVTYTGQTVASLVQHPSLGAVMQLAGRLGLSNELPISPYAVQNLLTGYGGINSVGGITGKLGSLSGLITGSYNSDRIYDCADNSFTCQTSRNQAMSNASMKGITGQLYQQMANHIPVLQGLRDRAATATTPAERENIMEQIQLENAWVANTTGQLQSVSYMADAQHRVFEQQQNEKFVGDIDAVLARAPR